MTIDEIRKQIIEEGGNPDEYSFLLMENGYQAWKKEFAPAWFKNSQQIARQEDEPIKQDIDDVAELTVITALDKDEIAEMLVFALQRIDELEGRLNG